MADCDASAQTAGGTTFASPDGRLASTWATGPSNDNAVNVEFSAKLKYDSIRGLVNEYAESNPKSIDLVRQINGAFSSIGSLRREVQKYFKKRKKYNVQNVLRKYHEALIEHAKVLVLTKKIEELRALLTEIPKQGVHLRNKISERIKEFEMEEPQEEPQPPEQGQTSMDPTDLQKSRSELDTNIYRFMEDRVNFYTKGHIINQREFRSIEDSYDYLKDSKDKKLKEDANILYDIYKTLVKKQAYLIVSQYESLPNKVKLPLNQASDFEISTKSQLYNLSTLLNHVDDTELKYKIKTLIGKIKHRIQLFKDLESNIEPEIKSALEQFQILQNKVTEVVDNKTYTSSNFEAIRSAIRAIQASDDQNAIDDATTYINNSFHNHHEVIVNNTLESWQPEIISDSDNDERFKYILNDKRMDMLKIHHEIGNDNVKEMIQSAFTKNDKLIQEHIDVLVQMMYYIVGQLEFDSSQPKPIFETFYMECSVSDDINVKQQLGKIIERYDNILKNIETLETWKEHFERMIGEKNTSLETEQRADEIIKLQNMIAFYTERLVIVNGALQSQSTAIVSSVQSEPSASENTDINSLLDQIKGNRHPNAVFDKLISQSQETIIDKYVDYLKTIRDRQQLILWEKHYDRLSKDSNYDPGIMEFFLKEVKDSRRAVALENLVKFFDECRRGIEIIHEESDGSPRVQARADEAPGSPALLADQPAAETQQPGAGHNGTRDIESIGASYGSYT